MTLIRIDVHCHAVRPLLTSPKFRVSSAAYYIGLLSFERDHNVARFDTRAPGSLRHAVELVVHE